MKIFSNLNFLSSNNYRGLLGNDLVNKILSKQFWDYLLQHPKIHLVFNLFVESNKVVSEDASVQFIYGVDIKNKESGEVIISFPLYSEYDSCIISSLASERREKNFRMITALVKFIELYLSEKYYQQFIGSIHIQKDNRVSNQLFSEGFFDISQENIDEISSQV